MKLDLELFRKLMLILEEKDTSQLRGNVFVLDLTNLADNDHNASEIAYHYQMMNDAGFVRDYNVIPDLQRAAKLKISPLTKSGHDFLETIRDKNMWERIKHYLTSNNLAFTIEGIRLFGPKLLAEVWK
ncbi:MAG: DUF2513 domain-containing protein [bacterium]|nr:DUF2513 domain-containing protein [bacterium]